MPNVLSLFYLFILLSFCLWRHVLVYDYLTKLCPECLRPYNESSAFLNSIFCFVNLFYVCMANFALRTSASQSRERWTPSTSRTGTSSAAATLDASSRTWKALSSTSTSIRWPWWSSRRPDRLVNQLNTKRFIRFILAKLFLIHLFSKSCFVMKEHYIWIWSPVIKWAVSFDHHVEVIQQGDRYLLLCRLEGPSSSPE